MERPDGETKLTGSLTLQLLVGRMRGRGLWGCCRVHIHLLGESRLSILSLTPVLRDPFGGSAASFKLWERGTFTLTRTGTVW